MKPLGGTRRRMRVFVLLGGAPTLAGCATEAGKGAELSPIAAAASGAPSERAALDYLITLGVNLSRMKTISYGEEMPACRDATDPCYLENRRVRFVEIRPRPVS